MFTIAKGVITALAFIFIFVLWAVVLTQRKSNGGALDNLVLVCCLIGNLLSWVAVYFIYKND